MDRRPSRPRADGRAPARVPNAHVLHGHLHYVVDRDRIFGATATVEDEAGAPRVRIYDVVGETLIPSMSSELPARKVA